MIRRKDGAQAYLRFLCGIPLALSFMTEGKEESMRVDERRNIPARAAVVQRVINGIVQNPSVTLTVDTLQAWLDIPLEAADRILVQGRDLRQGKRR